MSERSDHKKLMRNRKDIER